MIWPPAPKTRKKTGAPDTAPREMIQYIGLPSHFLDFKRSNRIFFMFIALSIWKFFYAGFVASHRLHISLEQTMLPHWGIPLLFLCNACRKVWFSSLCLGPFFRRQQFLFLKRAPRRTHRPVPAALRLTLHGRRPARSFQFTRCVIRFRSSCFSKGDVPFHG